MSPPGQKVSNMILRKNREVAPKKKKKKNKRLGQSGNYTVADVPGGESKV